MIPAPENPELHHTAYLVTDMAASIRRWEDLGARLELPATLVSADQVRVSFLAFQGGRIELVEPCEGSRIKGTGADRGRPDHLCFRCDNFDEMIKGARSSGGVVVRPPVPSQAFEGKRMAFVLYHALGLIEWVER
jgi:catechol 2,3-dioxygenase-like lactoylglutathione lyase family enzyme